MDIEKIRKEIQNKFGSDERAAEIIEEIFNGSISKEEALKEEAFLFESSVDAKLIIDLFDIQDYEEVIIYNKKMISMNNIRDAATVYYTLIHLEQLSKKDNTICVWCKTPLELFKDQLSEKEYKINGACQKCQDSIWKPKTKTKEMKK